MTYFHSRNELFRCSTPLILTFTLMLSACGGGGSGGGASTPPQSPPPPPASTIDVEVANQPVLENNLFIVKFSDSDITADLTVTQVSGPSATLLDNSQSAASTWKAPDFDTDTEAEMVFEASGTDPDGNTGTATVRVSVRGFSGPGHPVALMGSDFEFLAGNLGVPAQIGGNLNGSWRQAIGSLPSLPGSADNPRDFAFIGGQSDGFFTYRIRDEIESSFSFRAASFFQVGLLTFNLQENLGGGSNFLLLDDAEDRLRHFFLEGSSPPFTLVEGESVPFEDPCFVRERENTSQDYVWLGQKNNGLSVVRLLPLGNGAFDTEIIDKVGEQRSFCHIVATRFSERIYTPDFFDDSTLSNIMAIDYDTFEIVLYGESDEDNRYEQLEILPIETGSSANLEIVDVFSRGAAALAPRYIVILLADERDDGDHRLVVVSQNPDDQEYFQTVYPLGPGRPIQLLDGPFIGNPPLDQFARDIVVVTENSGSYILEFIEGPTTATAPTYGPPTLFDTGQGVGNGAVAQIADDLDINFEPVLLVAYPETGLVRQFRPGLEIAE